MKRASGKTNDDDIDDDNALLNRNDLYRDSVLPFEKSLYEKNRVLFLLQSALLGVSYAIIWPTVWMYIRNEFTDLDLPSKKILYGSVFVAYPLSSMVSAYFVEKTALDTRLLFVALNLSGIIGNVIYAINLHPACLFIGRIIAGVADAFYIVIMRDVKSTHNYKSGSIASECLCAFIVGLVLAQVLNAITIFIPFQLGLWKVTPNNYPGLTASLLFSLMALANRVFLNISDGENEYSAEPPNTDDNNENIIVRWDMFSSWGCKAGFISFFSFVHTYVVSLLEIMVPMFLYEKIHATALSSILLYGFMALLYAMILMFTLSNKSSVMLECFMLASVIFKMLALLAAICIILVPLKTLHAMVALVVIMSAITFMWSNDDVMYNNLIISMIPFRVRDYSHNLRKNTSKFAFIFAGVTVPFLYSTAILYVGASLTLLIGILFMTFVTVRTFCRVSNKI